MILTSDEEGPAINGVQKLIQNNVLQEYGIDMCLIGEPTSKTRLGDTIKNGRRGSLSGKILIKGQQGHIAYPQNAINPIHQVSPIIRELITKKYDEGDEFFPPTSFQISNIQRHSFKETRRQTWSINVSCSANSRMAPCPPLARSTVSAISRISG